MIESPRSFFRNHVAPQIPAHAVNVKTGLVREQTLVNRLIRQNDIEAETSTMNYVFPIEDHGYLKIGHGCENGSAIMEKLVWQISRIFEVDHLFVPTGELRISPQKAVKLHIKHRSIPTQGTLKASFQIAAKGQKLGDFVDSGKPLPHRRPLIQALVTSLAFGMMDAHASNIFIDDDGNLKFYDNCRSFPHSNILVSNNGEVILPYRCGLVELPEIYSNLSESEKKDILTFIEKFQENFCAFETFIRSEEVQKEVRQLPWGWFNTDKVITCTQERIVKLHQVAKSKSVSRLIDLIYETVPYYRFFSLTTLLYETILEQDNSVAFKEVTLIGPRVTLKDIGNFCMDADVDLSTVHDLVFKEKGTDEEWVEKMRRLKQEKGLPADRSNFAELLKMLMKLAEVDYKDIPQERLAICLANHAQILLALEDFKIGEFDDEDLYYVVNKRNRIWLHFRFENPIGVMILLNHTEAPGKLIVEKYPELGPMTPAELKKWVDDKLK